LALPRRGAGLFLPPLASGKVRVELEVIQEGPRFDEPPVMIKLDGALVALTEVASKRPGMRLLVAVVRPPSRSRPVELRLAPASPAGDVRITRLRFS
jgi:hypothetical protein